MTPHTPLTVGFDLGIPLTHTTAAVATAVYADALVLPCRHPYDEPGEQRTLAMPGAADALQCVRSVGGRTVVVSAKFTPAVHGALGAAGANVALIDLHAFGPWLTRRLFQNG